MYNPFWEIYATPNEMFKQVSGRLTEMKNSFWEMNCPSPMCLTAGLVSSLIVLYLQLNVQIKYLYPGESLNWLFQKSPPMASLKLNVDMSVSSICLRSCLSKGNHIDIFEGSAWILDNSL